MKKSFTAITTEATSYHVRTESNTQDSFRMYPINTADYNNRQAWSYNLHDNLWKAYTPYRQNNFIGSKAACADWCLDQIVNGYTVCE